MRKRWKFLTLYLLFAIPFLTGFYFHESPYPSIFSYDTQYFIFLIVLSLFVGIALPLLLVRFMNKHGGKALAFSLFPTFLLLIVVYIVFSIKYYDRRNHGSLFEPFVQVPRPPLDPNSITEDDFVILCLGGSTTRNARVPEDKRYPEVLRREIQAAHPELNVKVINAGMDWYTTKHSLINYTTFYHQFKPDIVVIMHAINDVYRSFSPKSAAIGAPNWDYSHFYGAAIRGASERPTFERHLYEGFTSVWFSLYLTPGDHAKPQDFGIERFSSLEPYKFYLRSLVNFVKKEGAECLVMEQSALYSESPSPEAEKVLWFGQGMCNDNAGKFASNLSMYRVMKEFNAAAKQIAREENVRYIPTSHQIASTVEYFQDDVHYTEKGAVTLGLTAAAFIRDSVDERVWKDNGTEELANFE